MIDRYIDELDAALHVSRRMRRRILEDVRQHLTDAVEPRAGIDAVDAAREAVAAFGDPVALAAAFNDEHAVRVAHHTPIAMAAAGVLLSAGVVVAAAAGQHGTPTAQAAREQSLCFFGAMLAVELAVVCAVRVSARCLAVWRHTPDSADRRLVTRAWRIFTAAVIAAAFGFSIAGWPDQQANAPIAAVGVLLMGAAVAVAVSQLAGTTANATGCRGVDAESALAIPEHFIAIVRRHPVAACALAAAAAAACAMEHAETTVAAALPWGAAQAAAVIAGFVVLGPQLDLRET